MKNNMYKLKEAYAKKGKTPKWISQSHWEELLAYWNSPKFKDRSKIQSQNRLSNKDGLRPLKHSGGSISVTELRRKYVN